MNATAISTSRRRLPFSVDDAVDQALRESMTFSNRRRRETQMWVVQVSMPLATSLAHRYAGRGIAIEDLEQVAYLGLVKAVRGFDPCRGSDLASYAVPTIRGELRRHFRDSGWAVRPPRRIQELQAQLSAVQEGLIQQLHRMPTARELADATGASTADVTEALATRGCFAPQSLDEPLTGNDAGSLGERIELEERGFSQAEARVLLADAMCHLGSRDRKIVAMRYFEGKTQQEIGLDLGVTQMQVSRLLARILDDLRRYLDAEVA